jgi:hypothetical protein
MMWEGHVACMEEEESNMLNRKECDHLIDLDVDGRGILKWILKK